MSAINITEQTLFEQELEAGLVLVDFYAEWCGPCKMLSPFLDELATETEGWAKIMKVNVDLCPDLASKYRVLSVPTLILFKDGEVVHQDTGFRPKANLLALLNSHR